MMYDKINSYFVLISSKPFILQLDRQTLSIAVRFLRAKTPEQRAAVDLDTHYTKVTNVVNVVYDLCNIENL